MSEDIHVIKLIYLPAKAEENLYVRAIYTTRLTRLLRAAAVAAAKWKKVVLEKLPLIADQIKLYVILQTMYLERSMKAWNWEELKN